MLLLISYYHAWYVTFSSLCQESFCELGSSLCITLVKCFAILILLFLRGVCLSIILYMSIEICQLRRQISVSNICSFSQMLHFFLFFNIFFPCLIIFLIITVLHLLLCIISNLTSLTKTFFCFYKLHFLY